MLLLARVVFSPFSNRYRAVSGFEKLLSGSSISHKRMEVLKEIGAVN